MCNIKYSILFLFLDVPICFQEKWNCCYCYFSLEQQARFCGSAFCAYVWSHFLKVSDILFYIFNVAQVSLALPHRSQLKLQLSKNEVLILSSEWKIITNWFYWVTRKPLHIKLLYILLPIQLLNCDNRVLVFTAWKVTVFGVFLVCSFSYLEWIWRDTPYHSAFSPNAGKSWPFHVTGLL